MRSRRTRITTRDLLISVAVVGLMLGHFTHLFRTQSGRTRLTIRVFNKTRENIDFLRYEWVAVARLVESHGANSGTVGIAPGGRKTFRVDLPGPVDLTLFCRTQGGRLTSGPVRIDDGGGPTRSLDFYVRPSGVVVRGTTGSGKQRDSKPSGNAGP